MDDATLAISEIFYSIQGESTWAGRPCLFIRLAGCHLRCHYCDSEYAFADGQTMSLDDILADLDTRAPHCSLVEVTGGEPLLQQNVHPLMARLADAGKTVLLETSGACDIQPCDPRVIRILDLKTPDSGEEQRNLWANLEHLNAFDEVKFVICSRRDYDWAKDVINRHQLPDRVKAVLMSPVQAVPPGRFIEGAQPLPLDDLARWVLDDQLPVVMQTQLHKLIWPTIHRGV